MKRIQIGDVVIENEEQRQMLLEETRERNYLDDELDDDLQALIGSCKNIKITHPVKMSLYTRKKPSKFIQVINYHPDLEIEDCEYGYDIDEDARILVQQV